MFKRFCAGLVCMCMVLGLLCVVAVSADGGGEEATTPWSVTLKGIDFKTSDEVSRGLYMDDNSRPSGNDFTDAHLQMSAGSSYSIQDQERGLWAEHEFYAPEAGYYDMSGVLSESRTSSNCWVSPWYLQINDGLQCDGENVVVSKTNAEGSMLFNTTMKQVYLNAGVNKVTIGTFHKSGGQDSVESRQYLMKIKSVTFTKSTTVPAETISVPVNEGYSIENINPAQTCSNTLSIKASGDYFIIQTGDSSPAYDGYRIKYPVYVTKGGIYKLTGMANSYKCAYLSPHKISFDDDAPMDTRQMAANKTTAMDPTAYDYGIFYLEAGIHNLVVTVDATINNGNGAGYKMTLDDSFTLTPYTNTALSYGGNECDYPVEFKQALQSDNIVYLYSYTSGAVDGNTYDFTYRVTVPQSGYYELKYTDCDNNGYSWYNIPKISVNGSNFGDTKTLIGSTSVTNNVRDLGAVYMEAGKVNTVTVRISGFRTHKDGGYYLMNGGITLEKLSDDIVITAESLLYNTTSAAIKTGGNTVLEHWTQAEFTENQTYKLYASEDGTYDMNVFASASLGGVKINGVYYEVKEVIDNTGTDAAAADKNVIGYVPINKGENTLELVLKDGATLYIDCIRANKAETEPAYGANVINYFRYTQNAGSGNDRRGIVANVMSESARTCSIVIAEYNAENDTIEKIYVKDNEALAEGNNVINLDLTEGLTTAMNTNPVKVFVFDNMGNLTPYAKNIYFEKKIQ